MTETKLDLSAQLKARVEEGKPVCTAFGTVVDYNPDAAVFILENVPGHEGGTNIPESFYMETVKRALEL